jgi:hypothetical protein
MALQIISISIWLQLILFSSIYAEIRITGLDKTNQDWFLNYIDVKEHEIASVNLDWLRKRILSTQLFSNVIVERIDNTTLEIEVEEKWTLIPVVRGAYGGGTPLTVLGFYDIHGLGRFYTLGLEMRQYASAKPGGIAYFRTPGLNQGRREFSLELWHNNRIRNIYHLQSEPIEIQVSQRKFIFHMMHSIRSSWRLGIVLQQESYQRSHVSQEDERLRFLTARSDVFAPAIVLSHNNLFFDNILIDGHKLDVQGGPIFYDPSLYRHVIDFYFYRRHDLFNLAAHFNHSYINSDIYELGYFIGGFDSVRGLPDSYYFGHERFVTNLEARRIFLKRKDYWLQSAVFVDYGACRQKLLGLQSASSLGTGLRFIVPRVHRFVLRADIAKSLSSPDEWGVSIGMNQFFQPDSPLKE